MQSTRPCSVADCSGHVRALGYCNKHYVRYKRHGDAEYVRPKVTETICSHQGCIEMSAKKLLCNSHYRKQRLYGDPEGAPQKREPKQKQACTLEECESSAASLGLCGKHYTRLRRTGATDLLVTAQPDCSVEGCLLPHRARGYCARHLQRWYKYGTPGPARALRGTRSTGTDGYVMVSVGGRRIAEHRYMMELHLGRRLFADENVHHINGVKDDNRIDNLELWSTYQPSGQRVSDKLRWAREIIERYAD